MMNRGQSILLPDMADSICCGGTHDGTSRADPDKKTSAYTVNMTSI